MTTEHPSYPNPIIQEALCEIHFQLGEGRAWAPVLFGAFSKQIQNEFPESEPVAEVGIRISVGPEGLGQTLLPPRQRMRYRHKARPLTWQLSDTILTINILPKYPGWTQMRTDVLDAGDQLGRLLGPVGISRIGLRYINRLERMGAGEKPGDWLVSSDYLPRGVLASGPGFFARIETRLDAENRLIVTLGELPVEPEQTPVFVLDIDRIVERKTMSDHASLPTELDRLHDAVWDVFAASRSERLEQYLRGGPS
jgi:uncharacterized protein (TIGR04255 family)